MRTNRRYISFLDAAFVLISILSYALLAFGQNNQQLSQVDTEDLNDNLILTVDTGREKYAIGQPIEIFGNLSGGNKNISDSQVRIVISPTPSGSEAIVNTTLNVINGSYS